MTAAEARKKQWESLKEQPLSAKLKYIFTYYWPGIAGGLCVVIFLVSWIGNILTQKEIALSGHMLNALPKQNYTGNICQEFMDLKALSPEEYEFRLTSDSALLSDSPQESFAAMEALVTRIAVGEIDFIIGDLESYTKFSAYHADLRSVLTQAQLEKYKDLLVYVEKEALDKLTSDDFEEHAFPEYYLSPEGLTDPLPIGIRLPESCKLLQAYGFPKGEVVFGIPHSSQHKENVLAFLEFAMS